MSGTTWRLSIWVPQGRTTRPSSWSTISVDITPYCRNLHKEDGDARPSYFSTPSSFTVADHSKVRNTSTRITNDHSRKDTPIALLYHRFGCFLNCANEDSMDPLFSPDKRQFEIGIDDFANKMSKYYPDETARGVQMPFFDAILNRESTCSRQ
jgi:hypothetical protein